MSQAPVAELDLRHHGRLPADISSRFNELSYALRGPFNEIVTELSRPHIDSLDWWVTGPSSRNTLASPFFHHYCSLHLVRELLDEGSFPFGLVVVDSQVMRGMISDMLRSLGIVNCRVRYMPRSRGPARRLLKRVFGGPTFVARKGIQCLIARWSRGASAARMPARPIVVIDTFVTPAYATSDRWYGSFWEHLTEEAKVETFFVPTLVLAPVRSMHSVYKRLRANGRQVLIKEDFLGPSDLVFALGHKRRLKKLEIPPVMAVGQDVSHLVEEELDDNPDLLTTIESILTYRFVRRLSEQGLEVRLAIDWFEGQVIDKAWNLGFRRHFPTVRTVGYRAFESFPFYLCSYPIPIEKAAGVVPDTIAVQGRGTIPTVREFLPDLDVVVIPSFKSQHVWDESRGEQPGRFTVLVALPISHHTSVRIMDRLIDAVESLGVSQRDVRVVVKPHPAASAERLRQSVEARLPRSIEFTEEKSLPGLLRQSSVLISEASSACLEALACGVPVIVVGNEEGLTYDPIPPAVSGDLYRKAGTRADLAGALRHYMSWSPAEAQRQRAQGAMIRESYFEPITREGINRLMNIDALSGTPHV